MLGCFSCRYTHRFFHHTTTTHTSSFTCCSWFFRWWLCCKSKAKPTFQVLGRTLVDHWPQLAPTCVFVALHSSLSFRLIYFALVYMEKVDTNSFAHPFVRTTSISLAYHYYHHIKAIIPFSYTTLWIPYVEKLTMR